LTLFATALGDSFRALLAAHTLLVIVALIFVEELGVPSPVPSDLMMLLAGVEVAQHRQHLWVVLLMMTLATVAGASGLFAASRRVGRPVVERYGRFIHLTPQRLGAVEARLARHGFASIVAGRLIPGLRVVTPVAAGVLGGPYTTFLPALALGGFLYILAFTLVGMYVGPAALSAFERLSLPIAALCSLVALAALVYIAKEAQGALRDERTVVLGVLAGMMALLATNGVLGFLRFGFRLSGQAGVLASTGVGSGWRLLLGWPLFLVTASVIGAAYHLLHLHRLPDLARVALFAVPPLLLVLLVIYPLAEVREAGGESRHDAVLVAVEVVRWLVFGIALNALMEAALPAATSPPDMGSSPLSHN
jgi:membrane-associated protein